MQSVRLRELQFTENMRPGIVEAAVINLPTSMER